MEGNSQLQPSTGWLAPTWPLRPVNNIPPQNWALWSPEAPPQDEPCWHSWLPLWSRGANCWAYPSVLVLPPLRPSQVGILAQPYSPDRNFMVASHSCSTQWATSLQPDSMYSMVMIREHRRRRRWNINSFAKCSRHLNSTLHRISQDQKYPHWPGKITILHKKFAWAIEA